MVRAHRQFETGEDLRLVPGSANQTGREPRLAPSTVAPASGANALRSKCGRRPMAAVRRFTILAGTPGSRRLKEA